MAVNATRNAQILPQTAAQVGPSGGTPSGPVQLVCGDGDKLESWRPVVGFEGLYEVSDRGRVRRVGAQRTLRPAPINDLGHLQVKLSRDGKQHGRLVSRLVLEAFVGPRPDGMQARHVHDPDPNNNTLPNLAWGTSADNCDDKVRHGSMRRSSRKQHVRAREATAERMRQRYGEAANEPVAAPHPTLANAGG